MVILLIIAVYLTIGMEVGLAMYEKELLSKKSDKEDIPWLIIISVLWIIMLIIGCIVEKQEQTEKKSKEDEA